jgi:hypothetical protein
MGSPTEPEGEPNLNHRVTEDLNDLPVSQCLSDSVVNLLLRAGMKTGADAIGAAKERVETRA